jgi:hypothetical protein
MSGGRAAAVKGEGKEGINGRKRKNRISRRRRW